MFCAAARHCYHRNDWSSLFSSSYAAFFEDEHEDDDEDDSHRRWPLTALF